jgi:hypothetical protein
MRTLDVDLDSRASIVDILKRLTILLSSVRYFILKKLIKFS